MPDPITLMPDWIRGQVVRVADGDTIRVQAHLGLGIEARAEPCRLLGIQAPELQGDDKLLGQEARRVLSSLVLERTVYIHAPGEQRDRYGRWLIWLWLPERDRLRSINTEMVHTGHAWQWWPKGWGHRGSLPPRVVARPGPLTAE